MNDTLQVQLSTFAVCDDIRPELGGKLTLVGYYGRAIRVGQIPAALPKLCFLAQFGAITEATDVNIRIVSPTGVVLLNAEKLRIGIPHQSLLVPAEYRYTQLLLQIVPMPLNEEGIYRAEFEFPSAHPIAANFYVAVDPTLVLKSGVESTRAEASQAERSPNASVTVD